MKNITTAIGTVLILTYASASFAATAETNADVAAASTASAAPTGVAANSTALTYVGVGAGFGFIKEDLSSNTSKTNNFTSDVHAGYLMKLDDSQTPFILGPELTISHFYPADHDSANNDTAAPVDLQLVFGKFFTEKLYASIGVGGFVNLDRDGSKSLEHGISGTVAVGYQFTKHVGAALYHKDFRDNLDGGATANYTAVGLNYYF